MGTVLVDRYRVICGNCGYDSEFMIGAGRGDYDAINEARRHHANANDSQERHCPTDRFLLVTKLEKLASLGGSAPMSELRDWRKHATPMCALSREGERHSLCDGWHRHGGQIERCECPCHGSVANPEPSVPLSAIRALVQQWRIEEIVAGQCSVEFSQEAAEIAGKEAETLARCRKALAALCPGRAVVSG